MQCRKEKYDFISRNTLAQAQKTVQPDFTNLWVFLRTLCASVQLLDAERTQRYTVQLDHILESQQSWQHFIKDLESFVNYPRGCFTNIPFADMLLRLKTCEPTFENLTEEEMGKLEEKFRRFRR